MTREKLEALCAEIIDIKRYLRKRIAVRLWSLPDGETVVRYSRPVTAFDVAEDFGCDPFDPALQPVIS
ncbi:MAG: hypothetical protein DI596_12215 [Azospira oryzae]|nr:MAG: hypothetical protein DI596_12215 [Azospira oryzae]PZP77567.1 MAG: hypothetical protein DI593_12215 [Azospira oryzae]